MGNDRVGRCGGEEWGMWGCSHGEKRVRAGERSGERDGERDIGMMNWRRCNGRREVEKGGREGDI